MLIICILIALNIFNIMLIWKVANKFNKCYKQIGTTLRYDGVISQYHKLKKLIL